MDIKLDLYNEQCLNLANSMYLKFDLHALSIEKWWTGLSEINYDRTKWLEYMNSAGQYHEVNVPMEVVSLDTLTTISFDMDTLKEHPTTLSEYKQFGKYYNSLVTKYPDNEVLIKGILYGRDINDIIAMDDFHVIGHNEHLVDVQEYDLIQTLSENLSRLGVSVGCPGYSNVDIHYTTAIMAYVAQDIPVRIKRIRVSNSKKYNAHTFYIWSAINSVINLEEYKNYLSYDDVMFLFKNISRLKSGAASKDTFLEILTEIVKPKMIDAYYLKSEKIISDIVPESKDASANWFIEEVVNGDVVPITLDSVASEHLDRSNYEVTDASGDISDKIYTGYNDNIYPELSLVDTREVEGMIRKLLIDVDYAYLFSGTELLTGYYDIVMPDTGEIISLTHKEWMTTYTRILQIRYGNVTDTIPSHETTQLYRYDGIDRSRLLSIGIDEDTIESILRMVGTYPTVRNDNQVASDYVNAFNSSRSTVVSLIDRSYNRDNLLCITEANDVIFTSYIISLYPEGTLWSDWEVETGLSISSRSNDALDRIANSILSEVVGIDDIGTSTLVSMMAGLLNKFVSYKTNITHGAGSLSTIKLGGRPGWIGGCRDTSDIGYLVNNISYPVSAEISPSPTYITSTVGKVYTGAKSSIGSGAFASGTFVVGVLHKSNSVDVSSSSVDITATIL